MTIKSYYANIEPSEIDPIMILIQKYRQDPHPNKVDLSIGVYKPEDGDIKYVFPSVKQAKTEIYNNDQGHPYHFMSGLPSFVEGAQNTVFGKENVSTGKITSVQTISGTGAVHVGIEFCKNIGLNDFYVGTPTWGNYFGMIEHNGCNYKTFNHYDAKTGLPDLPSLFEAIDGMPQRSVLLLQACCHNPTGADYSQQQWHDISARVKAKNIFVLFDIAYQGFATGDKDLDAYGVRHFFDQGLEFIVCESFSKNMGLYGERVGCLHVVTNDKSTTENTSNLLVNIFRSQCSFGPLFGARIASQLFTDFKSQWDKDVYEVYNRLKSLRIKINDKFKKLGTPGNWDTILNQNGLFWFSGLTEVQVNKLINEHHIYLVGNGRMNVAGFNDDNIDHVVECIDRVVRAS